MKVKILSPILETILKSQDNEAILIQLEEGLREWLIDLGNKLENKELIEFAKKLNRNGLELCLHLGFSERAFLESLSGVVKLEVFKVEKKD